MTSIPESELKAWFSNKKVYTLKQRERHERAFSALDTVFVEEMNKKRKAEMDRLKKQAGK